ncbi:hypothetical protein CRE_25087 [Caenorhabditis remanei]|uniref:WH1 domain-containing protein n=1 Tax=Caenorhabditis remanei TaxID=31234 RepID=E3LSU7_CAERE|nr:hypothetical protein CRE_25087 [Caenorhabditis remanei]
MITPELSDFLEHEEKESILKAISASDKIVSSGICQYLIEDEGGWKKPETGAAVVLFVKNSSERYYRIIVIEPSSEKEWEPTIQFDFLIKDKKFETIQMHAKLLVFEDHNGKEIGLHFYDSKECDKFHNSVCKRQNAKTTENQGTPALDGKKPKKKKKSLFHSLFHKEPKKVLEIGEPTNFRHVDGVKMTEGQEDLYMEVMSKLKTHGPDEEELVKQLIVRNEDKFRQSMMVKKESQTVRVVKDKSKDKSKSFFGRSKTKIEDVSQPVVPVLATPSDPLNPDWNSDRSSVVASASSFSSASHRSSSTVTVTSSFKHSHTFAPDPIKSSDWDAPRKDTYGVVNQREPQNIYRFEQIEQSVEIQKKEIDERPPELPSRSTSRNVGEPISRTGLSTPRLPSHRGSYRWATQPETIPKQPPPTSNSPHSHQVDEYAEIKLSSRTPIRTAPPPPPATPPSLKTPISTTSSWRESSSVPSKSPSPKSAPPPPAPSAKSSSQHSLPPISNKAPPPPPPPLPTIATPSSVPPPPPPPPPPMIPQSDSDEDCSRPPSVRLSAVPESSTDRRSLMDQIRSTDRSTVLRKVSDTPDSRQSVVSPTSGTIVDQIQSFLDARRAGIHPSDSEGSDDEEDDEDWSD